MGPRSTSVATDIVRAGAGTQHAVRPPAVVRGWLYDPAEHWWALLVGAPPASC